MNIFQTEDHYYDDDGGVGSNHVNITEFSSLDSPLRKFAGDQHGIKQNRNYGKEEDFKIYDFV